MDVVVASIRSYRDVSTRVLGERPSKLRKNSSLFLVNVNAMRFMVVSQEMSCMYMCNLQRILQKIVVYTLYELHVKFTT